MRSKQPGPYSDKEDYETAAMTLIIAALIRSANVNMNITRSDLEKIADQLKGIRKQ